MEEVATANSKVDFLKCIKLSNEHLVHGCSIISHITDEGISAYVCVPYKSYSHIYALTEPIDYVYVHEMPEMNENMPASLARIQEKIEYLVRGDNLIMSLIQINPITGKSLQETSLELQDPIGKAYQTILAKMWNSASIMFQAICTKMIIDNIIYKS